MSTEKSYDVVVVGAGPAGSSAALKLAVEGVRVALIDKAGFPRYKTCGGGIVHRAMKYLPIDISPVVERECFTVEHHLHASKFHCSISRDRPIISMIMRDSFDHLLATEAHRAGAEVIYGRTVLDVRQDDAGSIVLVTDQDLFRASFVIAADGVHSIVARKTAWQEARYLIPALECEVYVDGKTLEQFSKTARFDFDLVPYGYAWIFPKRNHLSIGCLSMKRGKTRLFDFFRHYLEILGITLVTKVERHVSLIPVNSREDELMKGRVLLVGDAAGLTDPVFAEGISFAVLSGQIAANALVGGYLKEESVKDLFCHEIKEKILNELKIGKVVRRLIYRHPIIRTNLFRWCGRKLTDGMAQVFMGERSYREIIMNPLNYLNLLKVWDDTQNKM